MQDPQPQVEYDDLGRYVDIHDYVYQEGDEWPSSRANGYLYDRTAPFTEVLDGTEPFAGRGYDE